MYYAVWGIESNTNSLSVHLADMTTKQPALQVIIRVNPTRNSILHRQEAWKCLDNKEI